jgi:hypothetical protein
MSLVWKRVYLILLAILFVLVNDELGLERKNESHDFLIPGFLGKGFF